MSAGARPAYLLSSLPLKMCVLLSSEYNNKGAVRLHSWRIVKKTAEWLNILLIKLDQLVSSFSKQLLSAVKRKGDVTQCWTCSCPTFWNTLQASNLKWANIYKSKRVHRLKLVVILCVLISYFYYFQLNTGQTELTNYCFLFLLAFHILSQLFWNWDILHLNHWIMQTFWKKNQWNLKGASGVHALNALEPMILSLIHILRHMLVPNLYMTLSLWVVLAQIMHFRKSFSKMSWLLMLK